MLNGTVISSDIDRFDNNILNRLKVMGKVYIFELVANLMCNLIFPYTMYSDWIYIYLIERLEKIGLIKGYLIDDKKYIELI